jgi:DNA polymerase III epsilon subunit family exonuclease
MRACVVLGALWGVLAALPACGGASKALTNVTFVAFDVETTGLSARSGRVVEIAAVKFRNGQILATRNWLVNPGVPIPANARRIHGITDAMVAGKPAFGEVFPEFAEFVGDSVLLAHNATFDVRFMAAELARHELAGPGNKVIDTLGLARAWFPDARRHTLKHLVAHLTLKQPATDGQGLHRAGTDAFYVQALFLAGLRKRPGLTTLADLVRAAGDTLTLK